MCLALHGDTELGEVMALPCQAPETLSLWSPERDSGEDVGKLEPFTLLVGVPSGAITYGKQ